MDVSEQYVLERLPNIQYASPELGRGWTTWGDRRDRRSSITVARACAGCTSLGPGVLLGRRCRHHFQRLLRGASRGGLRGGPRGGGLTFSPTENLILRRALTISTPGPYWMKRGACCFLLFNITVDYFPMQIKTWWKQGIKQKKKIFWLKFSFSGQVIFPIYNL